MSAVWDWTKANPTKLTGWITTALATIQISSARTILFSEGQFEILVLIVGLVVSFIGMFNTGQATAVAAARTVEKAQEER